MKCPTCGYIGFETSDRCRNCGYEFALATPTPAAPDLAIKSGDAGGPLRELDMRPAEPRPMPAVTARAENTTDLDRVLQNLDRVLGAPQPAAPDLPLFDEKDESDLAPVVVPGLAPRRPLAVRRTTPDPAKLKAKMSRPPADSAPRSLELPLPDRAEPWRGPATEVARAATAVEGAPPVRRIGAAALDLVIIGVIDAVVVSFTLRLCGLTASDLRVLPPLPLLAFFALINGGYFAVFTAAGGQTIGKMAFGLRVVGHADLPVSAGLSILRALGCLASVFSFGIGFVPAVLNDGGRALEDRLADTRVIRVPAS